MADASVQKDGRRGQGTLHERHTRNVIQTNSGTLPRSLLQIPMQRRLLRRRWPILTTGCLGDQRLQYSGHHRPEYSGQQTLSRCSRNVLPSAARKKRQKIHGRSQTRRPHRRDQKTPKDRTLERCDTLANCDTLATCDTLASCETLACPQQLIFIIIIIITIIIIIFIIIIFIFIVLNVIFNVQQEKQKVSPQEEKGKAQRGSKVQIGGSNVQMEKGKAQKGSKAQIGGSRGCTQARKESRSKTGKSGQAKHGKDKSSQNKDGQNASAKNKETIAPYKQHPDAARNGSGIQAFKGKCG